MTRSELLSRMEPDELYHWMVLEKLEPFGEFGEWLRTGIVASILANSNRGKNQKAFRPEDFMPKFAGADVLVEQSQPTQIMAMAIAQNAIVAARKRREKTSAQAHRDRQIRKQAKGSRAHGPAKSAR